MKNTDVGDGDSGALSTDDDKRQHRAELAHLSLGDVMLRMRRQSRVVDLKHGGVRAEEHRQVKCRLALTFQTDSQGLQST